MLPGAAVLGAPCSWRLSFCNTFAKHLLNTYCVHQLHKGGEYTGLPLKEQWGRQTGRQIITLLWHRSGDDRGMGTEAQGIQATAACAAYLGLLPLWPSLVQRMSRIPGGNPGRWLSKRSFHSWMCLVVANSPPSPVHSASRMAGAKEAPNVSPQRLPSQLMSP